MIAKVIMPQMGESVVEGTIVKWFKREGDVIEKDEVIVEITTEKIDVDIPSPAKGILKTIIANEGDTVEVGKEIALIEESEDRIEKEKLGKEFSQERVHIEESHFKTIPVVEKAGNEEIKTRPISPVVAKLISQYNIDIGAIKGSGLGGRVAKKDIIAYIQKKEVKKPVSEILEKKEEETLEILPLTGMRKAIAEHMVMSKRTSPHVTTVAEIDMTRLVEFVEKNKERFKNEEGIHLTYIPFIVKVVVGALKEFPQVNSSLEQDRIIIKKFYHIGVAVALEDGLIVPVIKNADRLKVSEIAKKLNDLAIRARARKLNPDEVTGGTFSITNPGVFGTILSTPIINQPQAAILGVEAIRKLPVVRNDEIVIRSMMFLCLSYDHRIIDGALAARFLQSIKKSLENPLEIISNIK